MKKRLFLFGLVLILGLASMTELGAAEASKPVGAYVSLPALREEALQGWQERFTVDGREVVVNAAISWMPEGDTCPLPEITLGEINQEESLIARYAGKGNVVDISTKRPYVDVNIDINGTTWFTDQKFFYGVGPGYRTQTERIEYGYHQPPAGTPEGLDMTFDAFYAFADEPIRAFTGLSLDDYYWSGDLCSVIWQVKEKKDGQRIHVEPMTRSGSWAIWGWQMFHGIPALPYGDGPYPRMVFNYRNETCYNFTVVPYQETRMLAEDVPLLSFEAVKRALTEQILAGHLWSIDEMEFGYIGTSAPGMDNRHFLLQPVWRIKGGYTDDPHTDKAVLPYQPSNAKEGRLVIPEAYGDYYFHAQTGEMFRRPTQNDNGCAMPAMEVLYWENVS